MRPPRRLERASNHKPSADARAIFASRTRIIARARSGVRQGTLFILVDSIAGGSLGTITIGPTLPDALQAMLNVFDFFKKHLGGRTALVPPEGLEDFVALEKLLGRALAVWKQAGFVPQVY